MIQLSLMEPGYDKNLKRIEILGFEPDIHDIPGMYLQVVEGCGYQVYELTPDEARKLASELLKEADNQTTLFGEHNES